MAGFTGYRIAKWYFEGQLKNKDAQIESLGTQLRVRGTSNGSLSSGSKAEIIGKFSSVGVSETVYIKRGAMSLSGEFDATVHLQRKSGENWGTVGTFTAAAEQTIEDGVSLPYRFNCVNITSGCVQYSLIGINE